MAVHEGGRELGGMVHLEPRARVDEEREARRVRLGEAVLREAMNLLEDALGGFLRIQLEAPASDQPQPVLLIHSRDVAFVLEGEQRHPLGLGLEAVGA